MGKKDNKVDNKTVYKEKGKGEKAESKKKNRNRFAQKSSPNFGSCACA